MGMKFCSDQLVDYINQLGFVFVKVPRDIRTGMMFRGWKDGGLEEFSDLLCNKLTVEGGDVGALSTTRSTKRKLSVVAKALQISLGSLAISSDSLVTVGLRNPSVRICQRAVLNAAVGKLESEIVDLMLEDWSMTSEEGEWFIVTQVLKSEGLTLFLESGQQVEVNVGEGLLPQSEALAVNLALDSNQRTVREHGGGTLPVAIGVKGVMVTEKYGRIQLGRPQFNVLGPVDAVEDEDEDEYEFAKTHWGRVLEMRRRG
jgi:hypothetical protein